jgi:hypothetical protein
MLHREHGGMFERDRTDGMAHRERLEPQGEIYLRPDRHPLADLFVSVLSA